MSKADKTWMAFYQQLVHYKQQHGHTAVSAPGLQAYHAARQRDPAWARVERAMYSPCDLDRLAKWVSRQREAYKQGKLREDRFELLEHVNFYWCAEDLGWDARYKELCNAVTKAITAGVKTEEIFIPSFKGQVVDTNMHFTKYDLNSYTPTQKILLDCFSHQDMRWASEQRLQYAHRTQKFKSMMNEYRKKKLEQLPGWKWWNDETEKKKLHDKSMTMNVRRVMRNVPHYMWSKVAEAMSACRLENETTGVPTPVIVTDPETDKQYFVERFKSGSFSLHHSWELNRAKSHTTTHDTLVFDCLNRLASDDGDNTTKKLRVNFSTHKRHHR